MLYNLGQLAELAPAAIASNLPGRENMALVPIIVPSLYPIAT